MKGEEWRVVSVGWWNERCEMKEVKLGEVRMWEKKEEVKSTLWCLQLQHHHLLLIFLISTQPSILNRPMAYPRQPLSSSNFHFNQSPFIYHIILLPNFAIYQINLLPNLRSNWFQKNNSEKQFLVSIFKSRFVIFYW